MWYKTYTYSRIITYLDLKYTLKHRKIDTVHPSTFQNKNNNNKTYKQ